ncbi:MAG TPA: NADH-quinone oxidoreductase subunit NuoH [Actinomycetes bacterium]|nr:NADH-quinone oxidoreductase subunit NuoH [Actinomycetes bacterium]
MAAVIADALILLAKVVGVFAVLMVMVLLTVYVERKVVSWMQTRVGPNRVGPFGLLQSLADGIKLFFKEDVRPAAADRVLYLVAPVVIMIPAFLSLTVIPFGTSFGGEPAQLADLNVGLLFVLAMGSLQVYGLVLAGYASGSNYPLLGGIRSSAQMISYEIPQGLSLVGVFMYAGTLSARGIVDAQRDPLQVGFLPDWLHLPGWYVIPQLPMFVVFLLAGLAETNRAPFDLPEAETELVGGYHTEYSGIRFALFFLAEYLNMITVAAVATTVFLGGPDGPAFGFLPWLWPIVWFLLKVCAFLFLFIWLRATLPRFRFDRLMAFGWKVLLPVALLWIGVTGVVLAVDLAPARTGLLAAAGVLVVLLLAITLAGPLTGRDRRAARGAAT